MNGKSPKSFPQINRLNDSVCPAYQCSFIKVEPFRCQIIHCRFYVICFNADMGILS